MPMIDPTQAEATWMYWGAWHLPAARKCCVIDYVCHQGIVALCSLAFVRQARLGLMSRRSLHLTNTSLIYQQARKAGWLARNRSPGYWRQKHATDVKAGWFPNPPKHPATASHGSTPHFTKSYGFKGIGYRVSGFRQSRGLVGHASTTQKVSSKTVSNKQN